MTIDELRDQVEQARLTVRRLQKGAATPSGDFDADLATETQLAGAERLVARLESQLSEARRIENADRERRAREEAEARQSEVRTLFYQRADEVLALVNAAARELHPTALTLSAALGEMRRLSNEHHDLERKPSDEEPDDLLSRLYHPGSLPPVFEHRLNDRVPLYGLLERALYQYLQPDAAHDTLRHVQRVNVESTRFMPEPTPQVTEANSLFARSRRGNLPDYFD